MSWKEFLMPKVMIADIDADTFAQEVLESPIPVVVEFFSPACRFCKRFRLIMDALADRYDGVVKFCRVNASENRKLAVEYNIFGVPTTLVFQGGETTDRFNGLMPEPEVAKRIDDVLK